MHCNQVDHIQHHHNENEKSSQWLCSRSKLVRFRVSGLLLDIVDMDTIFNCLDKQIHGRCAPCFKSSHLRNVSLEVTCYLFCLVRRQCSSSLPVIESRTGIVTATKSKMQNNWCRHHVIAFNIIEIYLYDCSASLWHQLYNWPRTAVQLT